MLVSIITPIYNRANLLLRIWNSLLRQDCFNFEWIIVDDGSSDDIDEYTSIFVSENFLVSNYKKKNGGKHTALNLGISKAQGELILILDSDDIIVDNAIALIANHWRKYKFDVSIAGLSFLKCDSLQKIVGDYFPITDSPVNNITMRYLYKVNGDKCEVFRRDILKEYKFPEFDNEKFMSECIVWNQIAEKYNMVYFNEMIYICEYLDEGLSRNIRTYFYRNPLGVAAMENGKIINLFPMKIRVISTLQYISYSLLGKKNMYNMYDDCRNKVLFLMLFPIGLMLALYKYIRILFGLY